MMRARVVFPSPGRPLKRTWSSASLRFRAALIATWRLGRVFFCPMNSSNEAGRSESSNLGSRSNGLPGIGRDCNGGLGRAQFVLQKTEPPGHGEVPGFLWQEVSVLQRLCGLVFRPEDL